MESFEIEHGRLEVTTSKTGIPLHMQWTVPIDKKETNQNESFIAPGIVIS